MRAAQPEGELWPWGLGPLSYSSQETPMLSGTVPQPPLSLLSHNSWLIFQT